jgi:hypothetical protein
MQVIDSFLQNSSVKSRIFIRGILLIRGFRGTPLARHAARQCKGERIDTYRGLACSSNSTNLIGVIPLNVSEKIPVCSDNN